MKHSIFSMRIHTNGVASTMEEVQRMRTGLANRQHLHARLGVQGAAFTRDYVRGLERHRTARSLGARPTQHHPRSARAIEADSNANAGIIRIPRWTGLARAFHDVVIMPGSGKIFLTIPADKRTYGKRAREFPPGMLVFTIVGGRFPALMFREGWTVAYWLARSVLQEQDRTLLPSDKAYRTLAKGVTALYLDEVRKGGLP